METDTQAREETGERVSMSLLPLTSFSCNPHVDDLSTTTLEKSFKIIVIKALVMFIVFAVFLILVELIALVYLSTFRKISQVDSDGFTEIRQVFGDPSRYDYVLNVSLICGNPRANDHFFRSRSTSDVMSTRGKLVLFPAVEPRTGGSAKNSSTMKRLEPI